MIAGSVKGGEFLVRDRRHGEVDQADQADGLGGGIIDAELIGCDEGVEHEKIGMGLDQQR